MTQMLAKPVDRRSALATLVTLALPTAIALASPDAQAQAFPSKPIKIVVPYAAGGSTDAIARLLGGKLAEAWGQSVLVDNKPGAGGLLGNDFVAKAAPDGHTLLLGITALVQLPHLQPKLPYDVSKDLIPVTQVALSANLFCVASRVNANSLAEFITLAKAQPGKLGYGSYGTGTSSHIHGEMLKTQAGIDMVHVPYKGGAPQLNDLLGGQLDAAMLDIANARAHLASGKFKVLAITGERRLKVVSETPTFTELGYKDFEPYGWFGFFLPAGTPRDVVAKTSAEIVRILQLPDVVSRVEALGLQVTAQGADAFAPTVQRDLATWGRTIAAGKVKLD